MSTPEQRMAEIVRAAYAPERDENGQAIVPRSLPPFDAQTEIARLGARLEVECSALRTRIRALEEKNEALERKSQALRGGGR